MLSTAPPPRYTVQVLLPYSQALNPNSIHRQLIAWRSDVEAIGQGKENRYGHFGFAIPTGDLPLLAHVFHASVDAYKTQLEDALAWSPSWVERHQAVDACTHSIVISMVAHRAVNHATMLLAFLSVLDAVLACVEDLRPAVLHWMPAQRVLAFSTYRMLRMEQGPCGPAINVRIAAIGDHDVIADTVGLSGLGLPDLQAVAHDRDPAELTTRLTRLARSMFVGDALDCPWIEEQALCLPWRDAITVELD
ncbi:MAG: hypothetical protein QM831_39480 [Kofleriaceae bacterium]